MPPPGRTLVIGLGNGGVIINISTFAAFEPDPAFPTSGVFRAGLAAYTKLFADKYAADNVPDLRTVADLGKPPPPNDPAGGFSRRHHLLEARTCVPPAVPRRRPYHTPRGERDLVKLCRSPPRAGLCMGREGFPVSPGVSIGVRIPADLILARGK